MGANLKGYESIKTYYINKLTAQLWQKTITLLSENER